MIFQNGYPAYRGMGVCPHSNRREQRKEKTFFERIRTSISAMLISKEHNATFSSIENPVDKNLSS